MKRVNLCVSDEEVALLERVAEWQSKMIPGAKPLITAIAAQCFRAGLSEAVAKVDGSKAKVAVKKPVKR
jgi:hypothetical protein